MNLKNSLIAGLTALTLACNSEDFWNGYHIINFNRGYRTVTLLREQNGCYDGMVETNLLGTSRMIYDFGVDGEVNDGLVDRIHGYTDYGRDLIRSKDYENFKDVFNEADRNLAEVKDIFAEYYPEFPRRCNRHSIK